MTIGDKLSKAIASYVASQSGISATVQALFEESPNEAATSKIICNTDTANERTILRGVYDCRGSVVLIQSIDAPSPLSSFRFQCKQLRNILGHETDTPNAIVAQDSDITIYNRSWYLEGMDEDAGERGFSATFTWRAVASIA